ncbi:hypothetical protein E7Z59_13865 [Robertkochia marina]|uniref:Lipocalin-like domain-containing protein n=1 Tax=Robertkochia marina TaxID=1227945 RepID=A0A4S3LWY4_9FLAO|nr:hypothetical protein [Robertkochia marina]THD65675.1 hypothetical protein E7Z59_13865 [Robertkochia marina]TRZ46643.1 hypothetical protein D3A96_03495 [Robertkochia marina]
MRLKQALFFLLLLPVISGCSDNDDDTSAGLVGTWRLEAVYYDPGDGSGDFASVESNKIIEFLADGTLISNGDLCTLSEEAGQETRASYNEELSELYVPGCQGELAVMTTLPFVLEGNRLEIYYQCIEGCGHRYKKVSG